MVNRPSTSRRSRLRRRLLLAHAVVTGLAGLVLIAWPAAIPGTVGIHLAPDAFLLSYLVAAAELGFSALSWLAARSTDSDAARAAMVACLVFHAASALLEGVAWRHSRAPALLANIVARVIIVGAFLALLAGREAHVASTVPSSPPG